MTVFGLASSGVRIRFGGVTVRVRIAVTAVQILQTTWDSRVLFRNPGAALTLRTGRDMRRELVSGSGGRQPGKVLLTKIERANK
jgi:hypothetical protein